jgi:hypothetical protein
VTPVNDDLIFIPSPTMPPPTPTPTFTPSPEPTATVTSEPVTTPSAGEGAQPIEQSTGSANDRTSPSLPAELPQDQVAIKVTANTDVWLEIAVDGELMFRGALASGESTGWVSGSEFSVYTSSGVNTVFTNHLGQTFRMGEETGEAFYYL